MSGRDLEADLQALLDEPLASALVRERTAFDQSLGASRGLVLFGAGNLGRRTLAGLRASHREPLAFADNNPALWGREVEGVPVLSPEAAARVHGASAAFVVTIWFGEGTDRMGDRVRQLVHLGCRTVVPFTTLYWQAPDLWLPHYAMDLPHKVLEAREEVLRAFALLGDGQSRAEFVAQVRLRLLADFEALPRPVGSEIYFPAELVAIRPDEAFVDCGAYDGDTSRAFLAQCGGAFGSIDAFEPDPGNFRKLEAFRDGLGEEMGRRVNLHQAATGNRSGKISFLAQGTASSHIGSGDLEVVCTTLDAALQGLRPTYLKMDIEGSELDALEGASQCIRAALPVLAVSAYHLQDHLWKVPLAIQALSSEYRVFLRPHVNDGWDLVCYGIPTGRLRH